MINNLLDFQLRETTHITGAVWSVWLERGLEWEELASFNITQPRRKVLNVYLKQNSISRWLAGALAAKRDRSRLVSSGTRLDCHRIHVFSNPQLQRLILVGADELDEIAQRFWHVLALSTTSRPLQDPSSNQSVLNHELVPVHLPNALENILNLILHASVFKAGWIAIRSGDYLEIRAHSNCADCQDARLSIDSNPLLRELIHTRRERVVNQRDADWAMTPRLGFIASTRCWLALPLVIGQRLIGLVALWGEAPPQPIELVNLVLLAGRIAPAVEGSIAFSDLSNHLHRMALLNDFAVTIASAMDLEQIVQRMFALLRRAFGTERINLLILSTDGSTVQSYLDHSGGIALQTIIKSDLPWLADLMDVFRADLLTTESSYQPVYPSSRSALVIPLKYRKQVIGALSLENTREGAFTVHDENLLVVIASHLAGLLENGRLRHEAEDRAKNFSLIHQVVEQVIGLTDASEVARITAELMARNFGYDLAGIALLMGTDEELQMVGIGGNEAELVKQGLTHIKSLRQGGIVKHVISTGKSMLVNDVSQEPIYRPIPGWDAGSEMCVPLNDGDKILGAVDVESRRKNAFSQNDLVVLELLAGILASVFSNAGQYQKLQATVDQLRATREELQERISAQHMAESRLIQAAKLAAVGEMAAGIAHELNNPLTTVSGFTELILDDLPLDFTARTDLELVLKEANRARDVVHRLLDFSRQSESVRAKYDLNELVTDVLALVDHLLHNSGIQVSTRLAVKLPWVSVDGSQIKQVVLNLIHNAIHAMPQGGDLQIRTAIRRRDRQTWATVGIQDTGSGISPENLERIFEPFFTTRAKDGGTGLGLSVSYGIVAEHGGFVDAESQVGKGSVFTVWLPVEASN